MGNIIFYFTGTGNSLVVARDIAGKIGDTRIVSIAEAINEDHIDLSYERIGFVFPVYFVSVPSIVKRFIGKLSFTKSQYIFGIITLGGSYGNTFTQLKQCIEERGGTLSGNSKVLMPGNCILKYGAYPVPLQKIIIKREKKKIDAISIQIKEKKVFYKERRGFASEFMEKSSQKMIADLGESSKSFHISEKCTGCATCVRLCPVNNIRMENGHPAWSNQCEQCMACIHWCPAQAIDFKDKTAKRKRYHNPEVKVSDLIASSRSHTA